MGIEGRQPSDRGPFGESGGWSRAQRITGCAAVAAAVVAAVADATEGNGTWVKWSRTGRCAAQQACKATRRLRGAGGALTAAVVLGDGDGNDGLPTHRACCAKPGMEDMGAVWPRYSARRKAE